MLRSASRLRGGTAAEPGFIAKGSSAIGRQVIHSAGIGLQSVDKYVNILLNAKH
jgi:hypothetical protein